MLHHGAARAACVMHMQVTRGGILDAEALCQGAQIGEVVQAPAHGQLQLRQQDRAEAVCCAGCCGGFAAHSRLGERLQA